jgi:hypothetical protein
MPLTPTYRGLSTPENNERYEPHNQPDIPCSMPTYVKTVGDHNMSFFAGYEQYQSDWNEFYAYRKYYISIGYQNYERR